MTEYLDTDDLKRLAHRLMGEALIRDEGLLASAANRPQTEVFGQECYRTVWDKAAALLHSIIRNHPLVDGNKRLGTEATFLFLWVNGWDAPSNPDDQEQFALSVASGKLDEVELIAVELQKMCSTS